MRAKLIAIAAALALIPAPPALAQTSDTWKGTFSPMYLWASELSGDATVRNAMTPVFLSFADAADMLGATFSFHIEAQKRRVGLFGDLSFVRLSTTSQFTLRLPSPRPIEGEIDLDNTFFEAGGSYVVNDPANFAVIGGLRTFTIGTNIEFTGANVAVTPVDASRTAVNVFGGFTYRPRIHDKFSFLSRADIGGGSGLSWSGFLGFEFRPKPWAGLVIGYKGLGVNFGSDTDDENLQEYDVTYYGPIFGLNFHWGAR
jgi:hypothetical protein